MTDLQGVLQYAKWSSNIYQNIFPNNLLQAYSKNGFDSWILDNKTEIVIVIRGTDDIHDVLQDVSMVAGILPKYTDYAIDVFSKAVKYATDKQLPIVACGHSLGGSLAQYITYRECIQSYTFNPYGIGDCLLKNHDIPITTRNKCQNYCITNDVVSSSSMQWQIGKVITLNVPQNMYKPDMSIIERTLFLHGIDTMVELLTEMVNCPINVDNSNLSEIPTSLKSFC